MTKLNTSQLFLKPLFTTGIFFLLFFSCKKEAPQPAVPELTTIEVSSLTHSSARSGGVINAIGGSAIVDAGICWRSEAGGSAPECASASGSFGEFVVEMSALEPSTTYFVRAFATNASGTAYGEEIEFTTKAVPEYQVGEKGPAGGTVFYDKGNFDEGWRYLEAAPSGWYGTEEDPLAEWGCYGNILEAEFTHIGSGESNTATIVEECSERNIAAALCVEYSITVDDIVYEDWFLPSKDELNQMYLHLKLKDLGGFQDSYYWSSSENTRLIAWLQGYNDGLQYANLFRFNSIKVRPVRAF